MAVVVIVAVVVVVVAVVVVVVVDVFVPSPSLRPIQPSLTRLTRTTTLDCPEHCSSPVR